MAKGLYNTLTSNEFADSAGIKPEMYTEPVAIQVMKEIGIDISGYKPKKLTSGMYNSFDIFVIIGHDIDYPIISNKKILVWKIKDPKGKSLETYRATRNLIKKHVEKLIIGLEEKYC